MKEADLKYFIINYIKQNLKIVVEPVIENGGYYERIAIYVGNEFISGIPRY